MFLPINAADRRWNSACLRDSASTSNECNCFWVDCGAERRIRRKPSSISLTACRAARAGSAGPYASRGLAVSRPDEFGGGDQGIAMLAFADDFREREDHAAAPLVPSPEYTKAPPASNNAACRPARQRQCVAAIR